ncbi:nuclear receptor-binding protein 2 [Ditylenchus destructor]|uniref:Nuclear receptor-binding protein 2 n=1 Tax=Ditylenchus destructor TaxID=166010 RepID=A0AAD4N0C8_9BILA|nr:nuclear receptor-binding protein 2 [Ditylenchus destructor]
MGHNETRHILQMHASMEGNSLQVLLRLDDQMNRQLTTDRGDYDTAENLVEELVHHGFICESDSRECAQCWSTCSILPATTIRASRNAIKSARRQSGLLRLTPVV